MQLASTSTPRSASSSATCSYESGYRRYQRTHKAITSPGCWRPLNGLCKLIGMEFYPIRMPAPKFATEPDGPRAAAEAGAQLPECDDLPSDLNRRCYGRSDARCFRV